VIYQPWLAHWFPGLTMEQLERGYWTLDGIVAMADYARDSNQG
jgi:hypothetical protein